MIERAAILGAGSWGTALSVVLADRGIRTVLCGRHDEVRDEINDRHRNSHYLPDLELPLSVTGSTDIAEAAGCPLVLLAVPSRAARHVVADLAKVGIDSDALLLTCTKGMDAGSGHLMHQLLEEYFPGNPIAVLSGPSHAEEVASRMATAVTIGSRDPAVAARAQEVFTLPWFRTYTNEDVIGIEFGGVVKNVFALAAGATDGLGLGDNAKAGMVTRGLAEMTRLGVALGAAEATFRGLSGMGDLLATCYSDHSRNNRVGRLLGGGRTLEEAVEEIGQVAEGVPNAKTAYELARRLDARTPLIDQTYAVLYENKPAAVALRELLERNPRSEFD